MDRTEELIEHKLSLPTKFEGENLKVFCCYHKRDFKNKMDENQRQRLVEHHGKALIFLE